MTPLKISPSPYWPSPVLKNRCSIAALSGSAKFCSSLLTSVAAVFIPLCVCLRYPSWMVILFEDIVDWVVGFQLTTSAHHQCSLACYYLSASCAILLTLVY